MNVRVSSSPKRYANTGSSSSQPKAGKKDKASKPSWFKHDTNNNPNIIEEYSNAGERAVNKAEERKIEIDVKKVKEFKLKHFISTIDKNEVETAWESLKEYKANSYNKKWKKVFACIDWFSAREILEEDAKKIFESLKNSTKIKKELRDSARNVHKGSHEFINAAQMSEFILKTALGLTDLENQIENSDGGSFTIGDLVQKQRVPTFEYIVKPKRISKHSKDIQAMLSFGKSLEEKNKYIFSGHIGSSFLKIGKSNKNCICKDATSRSGFHVEQLIQLGISTHLRSLSSRLTKLTDKYQCRGKDILKCFEDGGFDPRSHWKGIYIKDAKGVLKVAFLVEWYYAKRRTNEKYIRIGLQSSEKVSETTPTEIDTESEVREASSIDKDEIHISEKFIKSKELKDFLKKHKSELSKYKYINKKDNSINEDKLQSRLFKMMEKQDAFKK